MIDTLTYQAMHPHDKKGQLESTFSDDETISEETGPVDEQIYIFPRIIVGFHLQWKKWSGYK
jgi:hypothetical protein